MCGGGSGASGTTQYNWNDTLKPDWTQLLSDSTAKAYGNAYQQYQGPRIAGLMPDQQAAIGDIEKMTSAGGEPGAVAANNQAQSTLQGDYLPGSGANANPYSGMSSPYFNDTLRSGAADMARAYQQGTAADTTRMFNLAGAFGGSAHENAVGNNEAAFGKSLGQYVSGMQNDQYNRSNSDFEAERARQMGAIAPGQNTNNMFYQGTTALMGAGDATRSLTQDQMNQQYQDWLDKNNRDFQNADWLSGMYSRAQGGMSPNSTTQTAGYQASPFSQLLGAGLLYKGLT